MSDPVTLRVVDQLSSIDTGTWGRLAGADVCLSHAFLSSLEDTGCVGGNTGWHARHLTLWREERLVAALPLYEKHHSYGEYVFDWAWADAYARHGVAYYPKLLNAIPFTPVPGMRLLGETPSDRIALLHASLAAAESCGTSSIHYLLPEEEEGRWMADAGLMLRHGVQFHWFNRGYESFDAFLASMNHDKRKKIRQERRRAHAHGLRFEWLDGSRASEDDWIFFYRCYANTYAQHHSTPYLNPAFFLTLAARAPQSVRLLVARREHAPVACAFFLCDSEALYGRYWGALEHLPFLHFELCYYQAIEYCIRERINRFEGGAQGEHKLARGLEPVPTRSAHWIRDPRFRDAVDRFLSREREGVRFYLDELSERKPFKRSAQIDPGPF